MVFMFAPVSGNYSIKIKKYSALRDDITFQLFASQDLSKYNIENSSLGALASCSEVITVGAVDASNLQLENYSSMGPAIDGRLKPEFVAPDNVTTASYLPEKFKEVPHQYPMRQESLPWLWRKGERSVCRMPR